MRQTIAHVALVVRDYAEAIAFFTGLLNFTLVEDTYVPEQDKRWVLVAPPGSAGTSILLARAANEAQRAFVGNQTGGRVTFFLETDDFARDHAAMTRAGIEFVRPPLAAPYGTVAVFRDLYGNLWDLIERQRAGTHGAADTDHAVGARGDHDADRTVGARSDHDAARAVGDDDGDTAAVLALESAYDDAWNAGDVDGLLPLFADDAVVVNPRGESAAGIPEIRERIGAFLRGAARGSRHVSRITRVSFVTRDVAVVDGEARVMGGAAPGTLEHRFTDVLVRRDGRWLIGHVRAHSLSEH